MSVAPHAAETLDDAFRARRDGERLLVYAVLGSLAVHIAAVVVLPGFHTASVESPPPLHVTIVTPPPKRVEVAPPPGPKALPPAPRMARAPAPKPHLQQPPQKVAAAPPVPAPTMPPVLALPESAPIAAAPPAFTVPAAAEPAPAPAPVTSAPKSVATSASRESGGGGVRNAACTGPQPRYPLIARRNGVEGTVYVQFVVSKDGRPRDIKLEKSSGSPALDSAALEGARQWRCAPARRGQETVEQEVSVPVRFRLDSTS